MSNRLPLLAVLGLILGLLLPVATDADDLAVLSESQKSWLQNKGVLKLGYSDYPPYGFINEEGEADGILIDIWKLLKKKLSGRDYKFDFQPIVKPFYDQLKGLEEGQFDSLSGIFPLEDRKEKFDFTREITELPVQTRVYASVNYKNLDNLKTVADLKGLKVGVVKGDSSHVFAQEQRLRSIAYDSYLETIMALSGELGEGEGKKSATNEVDVIILDQPVVDWYRNKFLWREKIKDTSIKIDQRNLALPVKKGNIELRDILDIGISQITQEEWDKLRKKYGWK